MAATASTPCARATSHTPAATTASTTLINGPTIAIQNSSRARRGSPPSEETPPNMNSVMLATTSPRRRASKECASSCNSTEPKKNRLVTAATSRYAVSLHAKGGGQIAGHQGPGHQCKDE